MMSFSLLLLVAQLKLQKIKRATAQPQHGSTSALISNERGAWLAHATLTDPVEMAAYSLG
jgi:hypothetical protein